MKCNDTLYIIASYACNLKCSHCPSQLYNYQTDIVAIKQAIMQNDFDEYVLFGGEPLLDMQTFNEILSTGKLTGITTNLLMLTPDIAKTFDENGLKIATSWNASRFTPQQYEEWHSKLKILDDAGLDCTVLITLTDDLLAIQPEKLYKDVIERIDTHRSVDEIKFEYLVADNPEEYYGRCDDWLCSMHRCWKAEAINKIVDLLKRRKNIKNCHTVYTLTPDGIIHRGCPLSLSYKRHMFLDKCTTCEYSNICQPCILQPYCSFPKKLFRLIQEK